MHELSIAQGIVRTVEEIACEHKLCRIKQIRVTAGDMLGIVPESLNFCFGFAAEGTCAAGATIDLEIVPAEGLCETCGKHFELDASSYTCPCGSRSFQMISGKELRVVEVETV